MPGPSPAADDRHPDVEGCLVRLTEDAIGDLEDLFRADPQIVRWALKKMIHIEQNPNAGDALLGGLIGYRKIVVGDRDWRIVWRVQVDEVGDYVVDVAEVWALGYRKDSEIYAEVAARVAAAGSSPTATALAEVLKRFNKQAKGLRAKPEPDVPEPVPEWLRQTLTKVVGLRAEDVDALSLDEAMTRWDAYTTGSND